MITRAERGYADRPQTYAHSRVRNVSGTIREEARSQLSPNRRRRSGHAPSVFLARPRGSWRPRRMPASTPRRPQEDDGLDSDPSTRLGRKCSAFATMWERKPPKYRVLWKFLV